MELLAVAEKQSRIVRWRSLILDLDQHCARVGKRIVSTSKAEVELLHLLITRRNLPMTKEIIMSRVFGPDHARDLRQVDMFVARLRQSLAACGLSGLIQTIDGRGYAVLDDPGEPATAAGTQPHGWGIAALV